jgi:phenylpropionate dioxygenase-like ring-hydroxylating dioxygenase large terminal subunit
MWLHDTRLPHLLAPSAYHDEAHYRREVDQLFRRGWHFTATLDEIPNAGDFVTRDLVGTPLLVRNGASGPRVFVNVCAHRHALLTHAPCGSARRMRCQYHGWEYDDDGLVAKIPDAACFIPIQRGGERLREVRCATLGRLVFASLEAEGPSLEEHLGPRVVAMVQRLFGRGQRQAVCLAMDHPCNWKIPLENVLESYHVPMLHDNFVARHPRVFRFFQGASEERQTHELDARFTVVHDELGATSRVYRALVDRVRPGASLAFEHLHAFPSLLLGETSVVSFVQVVLPTSATTSRSLVRIYLDLGQENRPLVERALAPLADRLAGALFGMLMREDAPVFGEVQRGMRASRQPGVLGSREERIHAFQAFVLRALET